MKRHNKRGCGAENNVKIEPVAGVALLTEPSPVFPQRIEIDEKEQKYAEHAELDANRSAGPKQFVLGRERTLGGTQHVIVKATAGDHQNNGGGQQPSKQQTNAMSFLGVVACQDCSAYACGCAHRFVSSSST